MQGFNPVQSLKHKNKCIQKQVLCLAELGRPSVKESGSAQIEAASMDILVFIKKTSPYIWIQHEQHVD